MRGGVGPGFPHAVVGVVGEVAVGATHSHVENQEELKWKEMLHLSEKERKSKENVKHKGSTTDME